VREILQWSSNVGAVKIGMMMGKERLMKWMQAFGFAKPTGVDFPGEAAGLVPPADQWSGTTIANVPMGQGIAVTPMQMAAAFSTVANNGVAVKPRLIAQVGDAVYDDVEKHRVIPASVARDVRSMLATAVAKGTGAKAQIPGYEVAGKTGTAEKAVSTGGYSRTDYVASFIGMVPADHPRLVVLVAVDSPRTSIYGGDIAAPAVQKIMRFALQHLEIAP
jgi:cell division protein FtsI/penicillin-binding protein 2